MTKFYAGDVVEYGYLWKWQAEKGRQNAEKDRPACLVLTIVKDSGTHALLLAISSKPPKDDQVALEIPSRELSRAGLTGYDRGWITVSEFNYDILERSYYFNTRQTPLGHFSDGFMSELRSELRPYLKNNLGRVLRL